MDVGKNFQSIVSRENTVKHFFEWFMSSKNFFSLVISFRAFNLIMDNQNPANPVKYLRWNLSTKKLHLRCAWFLNTLIFSILRSLCIPNMHVNLKQTQSYNMCKDLKTKNTFINFSELVNTSNT